MVCQGINPRNLDILRNRFRINPDSFCTLEWNEIPLPSHGYKSYRKRLKVEIKRQEPREEKI
jgi:hypothetical protein